jgi:hypothetical protein
MIQLTLAMIQLTNSSFEVKAIFTQESVCETQATGTPYILF